MLQIKINRDSIHFLQWLACVKRFQSMDIIRVCEHPDHVTELYKKYREEENG